LKVKNTELKKTEAAEAARIADAEAAKKTPPQTLLQQIWSGLMNFEIPDHIG